jgi:DNA-binding NtrC family response regulator
VRELENRIKKGIILCNGPLIDSSDLDINDTAEAILPLAEARENFQRSYILNALDSNDGNKARTAKELDIDQRTIYRYLEKG